MVASFRKRESIVMERKRSDQEEERDAARVKKMTAVPFKKNKRGVEKDQRKGIHRKQTTQTSKRTKKKGEEMREGLGVLKQ